MRPAIDFKYNNLGMLQSIMNATGQDVEMSAVPVDGTSTVKDCGSPAADLAHISWATSNRHCEDETLSGGLLRTKSSVGKDG